MDESRIFATHVPIKDLDIAPSILEVLNCHLGNPFGYMRDLASQFESHHQFHRTNGRHNLWTDFMLLYPPREPWDWGDGDAVNLMARQAAFVRSNSRNADARSSRSDSTYMSTTDSSTSSSSQHTRADPWHEVLLFLRDGRTSTAYIPSQIGPIAHQVIADAFNLQHCEILRLHRLQSLPVDLEELQMDVYLVQLVQDGPTAPVLRFTLVDVEIYLPGGTQPVTYARNVLWLPNFVNRLSLFRLLHLEDHCTETPDRCHLFLNDFEIEQNNAATLDIDHGHYINVYIGACDSNLLDQMLQEEEEGDQMQLFQCAVSGERKPTVPTTMEAPH